MFKIGIGRPCTVELHTLYGDLVGRVPSIWGNNTSLEALKKVKLLNTFLTEKLKICAVNNHRIQSGTKISYAARVI